MAVKPFSLDHHEKKDSEMSPQPEMVTKRIQDKALQLLSDFPQGLRHSELCAKVAGWDPKLNSNTIKRQCFELDRTYSDRVYKPSKGFYRLIENKPSDESASPAVPAEVESERSLFPGPVQPRRPREEDFYQPFADWLTDDLEDTTRAIALGGNKFKDKWGTPDVIGKRESRHSDIVKGPIEIVSAEIKTDTLQLITAFGQACAYRIFSHKVYLVVPNSSSEEDLDRLDSLCMIYGIGLVTFDATNPSALDFRIMTRAARHEPDLFYTNKYMALIEKDLFS
ncbi:MAG TPA: hypothetical protein VN673_02510 [Clostridia bacterium]|nr:hypothetical protein [Clostridia bacterium]